MCKSHSTCTLSLRTFSHMFLVGCQYPSARDLTWIFFGFLIFWAPEPDVTLLFLHIWANQIQKKRTWVSKIMISRIFFKGESSSIFIFYYVFHSRFSSPPTSFLLSIIKTCQFWYQGGSSKLHKVWLLLNFQIQCLQHKLVRSNSFYRINSSSLIKLVFIALPIAVSSDHERIFELKGQPASFH